MRYRAFGNTSWRVSEIGAGTWAMGGMWGAVDEQEAIAALHRALACGVNVIDTARAYGDGRAEALIAKALAGRSETVYLATKVPPKNLEWPARRDVSVEEAFPAAWIIRCTEQSLRRLKRDTLDLQQLHVWAPGWLAQQDAWWPAVERLKREGKIRAFGISINDHDPDTGLELVSSGLIDSVQVIYNIFDQRPSERLFPLCQQHHVGVIARVPFDEGGLSGALTERTTFEADDWRVDYFRGERLQETVRRAGRLTFLIRDEIHTLAQAALKFCLSHPAVSTVIPGMRRRAHVEENCAVSDGKPLSTSELLQLKAHAWSRNFYR